jgi:23S rRNA (adenine2030-N6)-methyltransferase
MLSYQHLYHAGNMADVHKHSLLCWMLAYLTCKDKPLSYIETHAGRGVYDLTAPEALKTGEAAAGITRFAAAFDADHPYSQALEMVQSGYGPEYYAGSPLLAGLLLRATDKLHLAELHPQEYNALVDTMNGFNAQFYRQDGFEVALARTPPTPRRGLMLIDPSYEIKTDYDDIPGHIAAIHRKWNVGIIVLWYPILEGAPHRQMLTALHAANFPGTLVHELSFGSARPGHRIMGSGMFIVNAPYGLDAAAADITERLRA